MKKLLVFLMTALCAVCLAVTALASSITFGDTMPDFTVQPVVGESFTLSDALREKELVIINLWASWCGPCMSEFPHLQDAYEQYQDRVEIIALSCESSDDEAKVRNIVNQYGITFPMGRDTVGIAYAFGVTSIPTSIVVDRFGTISMVLTGAMPDVETITNLFDYYLDESYTESRLLTSIPVKRPDSVIMSAESELDAALNVADGTLRFANPANAYAWPMTVTENAGRSCVTSTNAAQSSTDAELILHVSAQAGDVLSYDFRTSTESSFDKLLLKVNGETKKVFSGEKDWSTYAYAFAEAGDHEVQFVYSKDYVGDGGEDAIWLDNISLLSGEKAAAALAANPVYPVSDKISLALVGDNVREVIVNDPLQALEKFFGSTIRYYIVSGNTVNLKATLTADVDPDDAVLVEFISDRSVPLALIAQEDGYAYTATVYSSATVGIPFAYAMLMPGSGAGNQAVVYFAGESEANKFVSEFLADENGNSNATWAYAADVTPTYEATVVDAAGAPVSGVMLQACTDTICAVHFTDANGKVSFTAEEPYAYEIHVLMAPEGYQADSEAVYTMPENGGAITIVLQNK